MLFIILFLPLVVAAPQEPIRESYILDIKNGTLRNVLFHDTPLEELDLSGLGIRHLEKNALDNVSTLKWLSLANNSLESLPEFMFSNLSNLEYLSLAENNLKNLEYLFVRLENLRVLNISCNPVLHLRRGHLFGLTKSTTILIEGNNLWSISTGTFTNSFLKDDEELKNLEKMKTELTMIQTTESAETEIELASERNALNGNMPTTKNEILKGQKLKLCMPNNIVLSIEPLENNSVANGCLEIPVNKEKRSVSLQGLGIKGFHEKWYQLQYLPIISLDLSNNEITEITKELLNDLPEDLIYVNLRGNRIRCIWSQVIENRHLKILNLSNNFLEKIEDGALAKTNLTSLTFFENQLESLSFVSSLPNTLQVLILAKNRFSSIPDRTFVNLPNLIYLNLVNNQIERLQNDVFKGLDSLQILIITKNRLVEIERDAFNGLKQLTTLNFYQNSLRELQKGTFSGLENLKDLNLSSNKLQKITADMFSDLPQNLGYLHIDFNEINSLEKGSFVNVPRFTLSLTGNKISTIPSGTFDLPTLRDLYLNNNTLTMIDGDSYEGLPQLKHLLLIENQINEISKGSCKNLASLSILNISRNPIQKLQNGALYGLSLARGNSIYIYENQLKEIQGALFEDI